MDPIDPLVFHYLHAIGSPELDSASDATRDILVARSACPQRAGAGELAALIAAGEFTPREVILHLVDEATQELTRDERDSLRALLLELLDLDPHLQMLCTYVANGR